MQPPPIDPDLGHSGYRHVLIVEDDPVQGDALADLLRGWGARVHAASTVQAALRAAARGRIRLALVNVNLGRGFEGVGLAHELEAAGCRVILVTGYRRGDLTPHLGAWRPRAIVFKPVERTTLAAAVVGVIGSRR